MNRTTSIVIGVIAALLIGGVVVWMLAASTMPIAQQQTTNQNSPANTPSAANPQQDSTNSDSSAAAATTASVTIQDMAFSPSKVTIKKGSTVTWTNQDGTGHTVVSDSSSPTGGLPSSNKLLNSGDTYSFTFDTVGTFTYHCSIHSSMRGTIEVVE